MHPRVVLILAIKALGIMVLILGLMGCFEKLLPVAVAFARSAEPFWRWPWSWFYDQLPRYSPSRVLLGVIMLLSSRAIARMILPPTKTSRNGRGTDTVDSLGDRSLNCDAVFGERASPLARPFRAHFVFAQSIRAVGIIALVETFTGRGGDLVILILMSEPWPIGSGRIEWGHLSVPALIFGLRLAVALALVLKADLIARLLRGRHAPMESLA